MTVPATAAPASGEERPTLALVRRARKMNRIMAATYPEAACELDFTNPYQLLVATVLSAQSTDKRVNLVTPVLFERFPDAYAMAHAERAEVEQIVRPTGFFRAKSDSILRLSHELITRFDGEVPATLPDLVSLPGVGRKTANVVLGEAFGVPGITVDTHFKRLVTRFGWTTQTDPNRIETEVACLFPRKDWTQLNHNVIWFGRRRCHARNPACGVCPLNRLCPAFGEGPTDPDKAAKLIREPRG